jgi:hypothetical protein
MKNIIFIFSLPRSGSTLLQRILLTYPQIGGTAEPWILLPFIYLQKKKGVFSEFSHKLSSKAINDFIQFLPNQNYTYNDYLGRFIKQLYSDQLNKGEFYFLDKTPRYYLIIQEIFHLFPDAKFIFLFRNPLEILSSIITTWNNGRLRLNNHYIDLFTGPQKLAEGYNLLKNKSYALKYESLVNNPDKELKELFEYLGLDYDPEIIRDFTNTNLLGKMGDPIGQKVYNSISNSSLEKWKTTLNTNKRISFSKRYLDNIGKYVLETHGYDYDDLLKQLNSLKPTKTGYLSDNFDLLISKIKRYIEYNQMREKVKIYKQFNDKAIFQHD